MTWEQRGNNSAETPGKTGGQGRPESRTNQQDRRPGPVCKTSIPGSNPGGASKLLRKLSCLFVHGASDRSQMDCSCSYPAARSSANTLILGELCVRTKGREEVFWTSTPKLSACHGRARAVLRRNSRGHALQLIVVVQSTTSRSRHDAVPRREIVTGQNRASRGVIRQPRTEG